MIVLVLIFFCSTLKATEMSYQLVFSVYDYENLGYNSCISTAQLRINHFIQNPEQVLRVAVPLNPTKQVKGVLLFSRFLSALGR